MADIGDKIPPDRQRLLNIGDVFEGKAGPDRLVTSP
jgi:hypothetical protein